MFSGNSKFITNKKVILGNKNTFFSFKLLLLLFLLCALQLKVTYICSVYFFLTGSFSMDILTLFVFQHILTLELLLRCGDVESNPGPRTKQCLSVCHYNINSIVAHNFAKLLSLEAFNALHNFDIICISESFLDSSFSSNDSALTLKGYKLVRADHPLDINRGGTCIYYKETLPI